MARNMKLAALIAPAVVFVILTGCSNEDGRKRHPDAERPLGVPVETVEVKRQTLEEVIDSIGSLEALEEVEIRPEIAGIIQAIHFQEGQPVKERELLFTLDDAELRQRLRACQAALEGTEVEMRNTRRIYQRRQELFEEKVIARETRDEARTEFEAARARVERLKAEIREIKEQLQETRIRSPINGRAGERRVDRGDFVAAGDLLVSIVRIDQLKATFTIPERFMRRIQTGQSIELQTASHPDRSFSGRVYFLSPRIREDTRQQLVKAMVDNAGGELLPGAFVTVELIVGQRPDTLVVPEEALVATRRGYGVFLVRDSKAVWQPVAIGLRKPGRVEIREGLQAGEIVIRNGQISVSDGDRVRIVGSS
jgi:membrane fusion protein (multidrug efflux system)